MADCCRTTAGTSTATPSWPPSTPTWLWSSTTSSETQNISWTKPMTAIPSWPLRYGIMYRWLSYGSGFGVYHIIWPHNFFSSAYSESITTTIIIKKSTKCWTKAARSASKLGVTRPKPDQPRAASSQLWPRQTSSSSASSWWRPGSCPRCCLPHSLWWNTCHKIY